MNAEQLLRHFERISEAPDAIPRLRRFILDLAVRGKLVEQDPSDEPAAELLKRIAEEKARLGTKSTVRSLDQDEIPFELPSGWSWSRIGEVCSKTGSGSTPRGGKDVYKKSGVIFLRSQNIYNDGLRLNDVVYIDEATHERMSGTRVVPDDLLLNITGGSMGRCCLVSGEAAEANVSQHVAILRAAFKGIERFLHKLVLSPYFQAYVFAEQTGAGRGGLPKNRMDKIAVAMPPLAEQHRIVARVDELMSLCDQLEAAKAEREECRDSLVAASLQRLNQPAEEEETFREHAHFTFNNLQRITTRAVHIKQLRQTILNLAVRGRLVPQDPSDEPAAVLLKRIAAEKEILRKAGIVRKGKPLDTIQDSEQPFLIPSHWAWSRVGNAVLLTQYGTSQKAYPSENGVPVLAMGNIQDGSVVWGNEKRIPVTSDELPDLYLKKYDLLYNRTNSAELVGKTGIFLGEDNVMTFASYLIRLRVSLACTDPRFINMAMNTSEFRATQIMPLIKKQTGQANVNGTALKNMLIPLPPLEEQRRIVAKVDELISICDQLEVQITETELDSRRFLEAVLNEALSPVTVKAA